MMIFGIEHSEYLEVCKKPILLYLAWEIATSVLSFISFEAYMYSTIISFFVIFGIPVYIGWTAFGKGMGWKRAFLPGAVYGAVFGIAQGVIWYILITNNPSYSAAAEYQINSTIENMANSTATGQTITREEVVGQFALLNIIIGPLFFGILFGILAGIAALATKYLGGTVAEIANSIMGQKKNRTEAKEGPVEEKVRQSKKFRRKR